MKQLTQNFDGAVRVQYVKICGNLDILKSLLCIVRLE